MNNISGLVALAVLGGSLMALGLYCLRVSIIELFRGRYYRKGQARRISRLRLVYMQVKKTIDLQHYLYNQPAADILKHMRKCKVRLRVKNER